MKKIIYSLALLLCLSFCFTLPDVKAEAVSLGTATTTDSYIKFDTSNTTAARMVVTAPSLKSGTTLYVTLCNSQKQAITQTFTMSSATGYIRFYTRKNAVYYVRAKVSSGTVAMKKEVTTYARNGSSFFEKATLVNDGETKTDTMGADVAEGASQYFKIKITNTNLVSVKFKKYGSSSKDDRLDIKIYDSNHDLVKMASGSIFEGQSSASIYVRNPDKLGYSKPGTYYIELTKKSKLSSFRYTITW